MAVGTRRRSATEDAMDGASPPRAAAGQENGEQVAGKDGKSKQRINMVFIGNVDAGKSTVAEKMLSLSGRVDEKIIQIYQKKAKDESLESWYVSYMMDFSEQQLKGKGVKVGQAQFETDNTKFIIIDAMDRSNYVTNMIGAASEADVAILIISARKGEFETGYERGSTCENALFASTLGVAKLIVLVNKMDDPTVEWSKGRYDEIEEKMLPLLTYSGYNVKKDVQILPVSALCGTNMKIKMDSRICNWWNGPCLFDVLDQIFFHDQKGPVRLPVIKCKDKGAFVMGNLESGIIQIGDTLLVMPNKVSVKVTDLGLGGKRVPFAGAVERITVKLSGVQEEDVMAGFVLSSVANHVGAFTEFNAQLQISELLDSAIFTAGYKSMLHMHSLVEECEVVHLIEEIDIKKNGCDSNNKKRKRSPVFVKNGAVVVCRIQVNSLICIEKFSDFRQLGRFTLQKEGKIVAAGKVLDVPPVGSCWEDDDDDEDDIISSFQKAQESSKFCFDQVIRHASSLEKKISELRSEKETLIKSESVLTKRVDTLQTKQAELEKELKRQQKQVHVVTEEKKSIFEACMNQIDGMRKETQGYWKTCCEAESRVAAAEGKCSAMEAKYKQFAVSNEAVVEQMKLLKQESEISERRMEKDRIDLQSKLTEMEKSYETKLKLAASAIHAKDTEIAALAKKNSALSVELSQKVNWIANCETQVAAVHDVLDEQRKCWSSMQDNCELQGLMQSQTVIDLKNVCAKLNTLGKGVAEKSRSTKGSDKPLKPPSAFLLFMEDFKKKYKGDATGVSKAGVAKWTSMSDVDKAPYYALYDSHRIEHPEKSAHNLHHTKPP